MKRTHLRWFAIPFAGFAVVALCSMSLPRVAAAGIDPEVRAGVYPGAEAFSLGGGLLVPMGKRQPWNFNPNVEATVAGDDDFVALSGDVHYDFRGTTNMSVWLGAGPALFVYDRPGADNDTQFGMNVLAGIGGKRGQMRPFAQLRGTVAEDNRIAIAGGLRF